MNDHPAIWPIIWEEIRRRRFSIPLISLILGLFLLATILTDPAINFSKPQSPGWWPRAMITGLLLVSGIMLLWGIHDAWQERKTHKHISFLETHDAPPRNNDGLLSKEAADIIASEGVGAVEHDDRKLVRGLIGVAGYGVAVSFFGFTLATVGIIAYWLSIWGVRNPIQIVLTSVLGTGAILVVFVKIGYLPLPKGEWFFHNFTVWLFKTVHLF